MFIGFWAFLSASKLLQIRFIKEKLLFEEQIEVNLALVLLVNSV
jgi:hypothetical protein